MKIVICPTEINDTPRIAVRNEVFDPAFPGLMKQVKGSRWLPELKCWHIPHSPETWATFKQLFQGYEIITDATKISSEQPKSKSVSKQENTESKPPKMEESPPLPFLLAPPDHIIIRFSSTVPDRFFVSVNKARADWFGLLKGIEGRTWHPDIKHWSFANTDDHKKTIKRIVGSAIRIDRKTDLRPGPLPERAMKPEKMPRPESLFDRLTDKQKTAVGALEAALNIERKEYSTIKSYRNSFIQFLYAHPDTLPSQITTAQIKAYFLERIREDYISKSTQGQLLSALKTFYERVLAQPEKTASLYRPAKEPYLPKILTKEEVTKLFGVVGNLKHKCLLMLLYGSGLRVGEVVHLKMQDLNFKEGTLFVHRSKGNKDRHTLLSANTAECLQRYMAEYKPRVWLFEGPEGGQYSVRSVQQIFANALKDAQIDKRLGTHSLRHSFATHLLVSTGNLDLVRKVLGHNSIETTQIYLHVSKEDLQKTRSPLDDLKI